MDASLWFSSDISLSDLKNRSTEAQLVFVVTYAKYFSKWRTGGGSSLIWTMVFWYRHGGVAWHYQEDFAMVWEATCTTPRFGDHRCWLLARRLGPPSLGLSSPSSRRTFVVRSTWQPQRGQLSPPNSKWPTHKSRPGFRTEERNGGRLQQRFVSRIGLIRVCWTHNKQHE